MKPPFVRPEHIHDWTGEISVTSHLRKPPGKAKLPAPKWRTSPPDAHLTLPRVRSDGTPGTPGPPTTWANVGPGECRPSVIIETYQRKRGRPGTNLSFHVAVLSIHLFFFPAPVLQARRGVRPHTINLLVVGILKKRVMAGDTPPAKSPPGAKSPPRSKSPPSPTSPKTPPAPRSPTRSKSASPAGQEPDPGPGGILPAEHWTQQVGTVSE